MEEAMPPALWTAASHGRAEEVRHLLMAGADIAERGGTSSFTPLHEAAFQGHESVVRLLLEKGADMSTTDIDGATPLHHAAWGGFEAVVLLLVEHGAEVSCISL
jgi:ankyrin repeat protein